ncbi:hypothetical protein SKB0120_05410 [Moraxella osloensis]
MTINLLTLLVIILLIALFLVIKQLLALKQVISQQAINVANAEQRMAEQQLRHVEELETAVKNARKKSLDAQRNFVRGQVGEHFTPFMPDFPYNPTDCQFLGKPIDYVIFQNVSACVDGLVDISEVQIILADVKTGNSRLTKSQEIIKQAIANGQVYFKEFRLKETDSNFRVATS